MFRCCLDTRTCRFIDGMLLGISLLILAAGCGPRLSSPTRFGTDTFNVQVPICRGGRVEVGTPATFSIVLIQGDPPYTVQWVLDNRLFRTDHLSKPNVTTQVGSRSLMGARSSVTITPTSTGQSLVVHAYQSGSTIGYTDLVFGSQSNCYVANP